MGYCVTELIRLADISPATCRYIIPRLSVCTCLPVVRSGLPISRLTMVRLSRYTGNEGLYITGVTDEDMYLSTYKSISFM